MVSHQNQIGHFGTDAWMEAALDYGIEAQFRNVRGLAPESPWPAIGANALPQH